MSRDGIVQRGKHEELLAVEGITIIYIMRKKKDL